MRRTAARRAARGRGGARARRLRQQPADYKNNPRPPAPIVITGSIDDQRVSVSPRALRRRPDRADRHQPDRRVAARDARERRRDGRARASGRRPRRSTRSDTATLQGRRQARPLHGPRRRRRHPRRAPAGRAERARARRTTCCSRRPPAGASATIVAMPVRALAALLCARAVFGARALAQEPPAQSPQALFRDVILKDADTTSGVKRLLRSDAGFVSPTPSSPTSPATASPTRW